MAFVKIAALHTPGVTDYPASMGSAIQAGDSAISRCRNRVLNTGRAGAPRREGARFLAGPRSGDDPRSVRARPSSIKRDADTLARNQGQAGACPDRVRRPSPARCRRVINVPLATAINGQLRSLRGQSSCLVSYVIAHDMSNSQAESAGSIPVTRSTVKSQVKSPS